MKSRVLYFVVLLLAAVPLYAQERSVDVTGFATWMSLSGNDAVNFDNEDFDIDFDSETGFGVAVNVFWSNRISTEFAVSVAEPQASFTSSNPAIPALNFGQLEVIPITAVLQYHFAPNARIDPYLGAGAAYLLFDQLDRTDDLDDLDIRKIDFKDDAGFVINGGMSFDITPKLAINADVKYVPVRSSATATFASGPGENFEIEVNPLIISAGLSYQF